MRINTNVSSLTAQEAATNTGKRITSSLEKLSTGLRINKASDDASGLAIADKLRTQATSINQGIMNGNSAVSLLQIADKSMAEQSNILDTIKSKLIQANTDTTSADGRESIRKDIAKLLEQLDNIAEQTNYNGNVLLQKSSTDKSLSNSLNFQVGETSRDIISNSSIQSNTDGLGSKTNYLNETNVKAGNSILVTSDSTINIQANGNTTNENVTLNGSVGEITLRNGATLSNVDSSTKAILDGMKNAGENIAYDSLSDTYSIGGNTPITLNLSSVSNVQATISTPSSEYFIPTEVKVGQVIQVTGGNLVDNSELSSKLSNSNLFQQMTGNSSIYVAIADTTINSLQVSGAVIENFKLMTTTNVEMGSSSTQFNSGDVITVNKAVTGGLLQTALQDTNMFTSGGTDANGNKTYIVNDKYAAGALRLMETESISITQGKASTIDGMNPNIQTSGWYADATGVGGDTISAGLKISGLSYIPKGTGTAEDIYQSTGNFTALQTVTGNTTSGKTLFGSGEDAISFVIRATGMAADDAGLSFSYKQGDIITLTKDSLTGGGVDADALSKELMSSTRFIALTGGRYQALTDGAVKLDGTDEIEVKRLIGSTAEPYKVSYDTTNTKNEQITMNDNAISLKTGSGNTVTIINNETTKGNNLSLTSATDMTNGKQSLSRIAELDAGELTSELASSFQTIVDDAITKLNNYRGDIGSTQNQVESAVRNLMTQATNVKAAESIIRDVDYASESANFNKQNIISQAGSYAISQSNAIQQNVLRLLQ